MLALEIEYLTGRAIATRHTEYLRAEWPPHPTRIFSALVCAWGERVPSTRENEPDLLAQSALEHDALAWLESLPAPEFHISKASEREVVPVFVPANDSATPRTWTKLPRAEVLPAQRPRQERTFPSVTPESRFIYLIWPQASVEEIAIHRPALERLTANVISVGHSSSLVRVSLCDSPPEPSHRPANPGEPARYALRVPSSGRLEELRQAFDLSQRLNDPGTQRRYTAATPETQTNERVGVFKELLVLPLKGPAIPLESTLRLTRTIRDAMMKHSQQPPCEALSGHQPDGRPTNRPHIAIIPMPFVGSTYADGDIKGVGVALPRDLVRSERQQILQALARVRELIIPGFGRWQIRPLLDLELALDSLRDHQYLRNSYCWATITPIILDRFPNRLFGDETKNIIAVACERIGLPRPSAISVSEVSAFRGAPPSFAFPSLSLNGKPIAQGGDRPRLRVHTQIEFAQRVCGPVLLGAGRFLGMGVCQSLDGRGR